MPPGACTGPGSGLHGSLPSLEQSMGQDEAFAMTAGLLRPEERGSDLFDRVERVDWRLKHAVAELGGKVGIDPAHLLGCPLRQAAAEIEPGQIDAAHVDRCAAHYRVLARHPPVPHHDTAIGTAVSDPLADVPAAAV